MPHAGIDRVLIVLPGLLHRRGHVRQPGVDARVVLGVHAEALGADAGDLFGPWARPVADDECLERGIVRRVPETLAAAPAEPDHADRVPTYGLDRLEVALRRVEVGRHLIGRNAHDVLT